MTPEIEKYIFETLEHLVNALKSMNSTQDAILIRLNSLELQNTLIKEYMDKLLR